MPNGDCILGIERSGSLLPSFFLQSKSGRGQAWQLVVLPLRKPSFYLPHIQFGFSYARTCRTTGWISIKLLEIITPKSIWVFYGAIEKACPDVQIRKKLPLLLLKPRPDYGKITENGFQPVILVCPSGSRAEAEKIRHGRIKRDIGRSGFPESLLRKNRLPIEKQSVLSSTRRIIFP